MQFTFALLLSVVLASGSAHALQRAATGDAAYLPYLTGSASMHSRISVHNDDPGEAKALRLNFVESHNGRVMLALNVYLRASDTWDAQVLPGDAGAPSRIELARDERSCTVAPQGLHFLTEAFAGRNADGGPEGVERTHEGALEVIELGTLQGPALAALDAGDCAALAAAFAPGGWWADDANTHVGAPGGVVSVQSDLVAVDGQWALDGIALAGFSDTARHRAPHVPLRITEPQTSDADGFSVAVDVGTQPRIVRVPATRAADAVSLAFAQGELIGDYALTPATDAGGWWIVAFPTRHAYVDDRPGGVLPPGTAPRAPFFARFDNGRACEPVPFEARGHEGEPLAPPFIDTLEVLQLCRQTQRLPLSRPITLGVAGAEAEAAEGKGFLLLAYEYPRRFDGQTLYGLPAVGATLQRYRAPLGDGVMADGIIDRSTARPLRTRPVVDVPAQVAVFASGFEAGALR